MKAVFFDFDGVLTTDFNTSETLYNNLSKKHTQFTIEQVSDCFRTHCGHLNAEPGSFNDTWSAFCACIGKEIPHQELTDALTDVPVNTEMFELALRLQSEYRLGIITTNAVERAKILNEKLHLSETFNPIIISGEVGATKHDGTTNIFDAALEAAQCSAEEAIFIDNQAKNLVVPKQMGIHTYLHDAQKNDVEVLRKTLREWGVDVQ